MYRMSDSAQFKLSDKINGVLFSDQHQHGALFLQQ